MIKVESFSPKRLAGHYEFDLFNEVRRYLDGFYINPERKQQYLDFLEKHGFLNVAVKGYTFEIKTEPPTFGASDGSKGGV